MKKALFFWSIFHLTGYISFLTGLTPALKHEVSNEDYYGYIYRHETKKNYIFTPEYEFKSMHENGKLTEEYRMFKDCEHCKYGEKENFWPFHNFTYSVTIYKGEIASGFVGLWGYYGHYEFLFYMVMPVLILILRFVYRKYIV